MKKSIYTAYTRTVNDKTFYFVKKYNDYEGVRNLPPVLDSMGMHKDFLRACELANVEREEDVMQLMDQLNLTFYSGKVISVSQLPEERETSRSSSIWYPQYWLSKLKWAHI